MAKKSPASNAATTSVEDKLRALYSLQIVDRRIDEIRSLRGELPLEVEDLEDEIAGLETRFTKVNDDINQAKTEIKGHKLMIKNCQEKIAKYEEQQKNVRNNREFDAIAKEIEFQELEIQLAEKHIREFEASLENKTIALNSVEAKLTERKSHLEFKKNELDNIIAETQREEELLLAKSETLSAVVGDDRLLGAYRRIRGKVRNGLAVVSIERGASAGSFFTIPPQRQMEIAQRKKITIDEHSGRILVDPLLAQEEEQKMAQELATILG